MTSWGRLCGAVSLVADGSEPLPGEMPGAFHEVERPHHCFLEDSPLVVSPHSENFRAAPDFAREGGGPEVDRLSDLPKTIQLMQR